jgi:hypothetical protein
MALVAESSMRGSSETVDAFATPTIVHFCIALLVAGTLSAPWSTLDAVAIGLVVIAGGGLGSPGVVGRRARRQTGYQPVFEDWLWHLILPAIAYAAMLGGALALYVHDVPGLFAIGAAALLLLFIGIHNAWDTVTWLTLSRLERDRAARTEAAPSAAREGDVALSPSPEPAEADPSATAGAR